ncbi:metallophosphoesterase [Comamonadaceae bacterium G21597-S1]|nr:metallophosphoesterase [Comamonadaceae bacterium G21597-S1]
MSLTPLVLLLMLLHGWVGWRLAPSLALWSPLAGSVLWMFLAASLVLMPLAFTGRRRQARGALATSVTWAGLIGMGLFSTLFVLTLVRDAVLVAALLAALAAGLAGAGWISLEPWMTASAVAVPVLTLLATAWGFWNARRTATVVRVDVPIAGLPEALHGFSVAQISDIHVGPTIGQRYVQRIVDRVNALGADMVAITGDLVDGQVDELRAHVAPLARLVSTHGSFFVTGNHEYYSGAHAWIAELRGLGVQVLLNEHRVLHHEGAAETLPDGVALHRDTEMVVVAGVADFSAHHFDASHRSDPRAAIHGAPAGVRLRLLLAHQPRSALAASGAGFDLQLSGHTHGGQFWPWMYFVRYQQPFTAGLRRLDDLWVYTNRGTGYWGPPKRFGVASEITHLRLVPA